MVQSKFYNGIKGTFSAIATHLKTYPFFLNEGGSYDVPKDQYDQLVDILHRGDTARSSLMRSEETLYKAIKEWEANNNVRFRDVVHPSGVNCKDVQLNIVDSTIDSEEADIVDTDRRIRDDIKRDNAPTAKEAMQVVAISTAIEGVVTFGLKVYEKKQAKNYLISLQKIGRTSGLIHQKGLSKAQSEVVQYMPLLILRLPLLPWLPRL